MSGENFDDELDPEVAERLEQEMAPIEEGARQELMEEAEEELNAQLAQRRAELESEGLDGDDLKDKLDEEENDLRDEARQEVEEELRVRLADERRLRLSLIQAEWEGERRDD